MLRNLQIFPHVIIMAKGVGAVIVLILEMRTLRKLREAPNLSKGLSWYWECWT